VNIPEDGKKPVHLHADYSKIPQQIGKKGKEVFIAGFTSSQNDENMNKLMRKQM
jgi:hypothetical protein